MARVPVLLALLATLGGGSQTHSGLTDEQLLLLSAVKNRARRYLLEIPNYTCLETVERAVRRAPKREFDSVDVLRMEVAVVEGKEMFSWPGERGFEERDLARMVGGGTVGTGSFALHARAVFLSDAPRFRFGAYETLEGRAVVRFDFDVPVTRSGYKIKVPPHEAEVAYFGSFWADLETKDLVRLHVEATEIPARLELARVAETMHYQRVPIGGGEFLLPRSSELVMVQMDGGENRNRIRFSRCRQYSGESTISFEDAPTTEPAAVVTPELVTLPAELELALELETQIDGRTAARGDPISARLVNNVKVEGKTLFPKGARAEGRIERLQRFTSPTEHWIVGMRFHTLAHQNRQARLSLLLTGTSPVRAIVFPPSEFFRTRQYAARIRYEEPPAGVGYIYWAMAPLETPRGLRTYWRTLPPRAEDIP